MRRNAYHGVHDLLRLLKENKPTESTGRAAPPQSATGTVLTTQRTCTPKSKDETSRRHPETQRERPGTPTNNTQTFIWRAPDLFQTTITGSTNKTTKNPDVIRKHTFTGETFAAECKHRSEIRYDSEKTSTASKLNPGTNYQLMQKLQQNREHPRMHRTGDPRRSKRPRTCIMHTP